MKRPSRATNLAKTAPKAKPGKLVAINSESTEPRKPAENKQVAKKLAPSKTTKVRGRPVESAKVRAISRFARSSASKKSQSQLSAQANRFRAYARKRRALSLTVIGSFAALGALVLATIFTPLLAVEEVKISGLKRIPEKSITKALAILEGRPLPLVDNTLVGGALKKYKLIESFSVIAQPPHRVIVRIVERTPIAVVNVGGKDYLYDPAGVRLGAADSTKVPRIEIANEPSNSAEFNAAIDVLLALPASLLPQVYSVDARTKDDVTLQLRGNSGQKIIWGDGANSVLKSKALAVLIKNHKKTDRVTFDVSSPTTPVAIY
jgi:cell division protein FtsQ